MLIHSLDGPTGLAKTLCEGCSLPLSGIEDRPFADGEHKWRPLQDPHGQEVWVLASLCGRPGTSPHDALCRLLMFVGTLRDHGATRIGALVPYLAYARKDRRTQPFDPLGLRYVAQMMEAVGLDELVVLEAHNEAAVQNAFRMPTRHLRAHPAFDEVATEAAEGTPVVVASPDLGGVQRAQRWREDLASRWDRSVGFALVDKRRSLGLVSGTSLVAGDVEGATVLLLDDLLDSGETAVRAATALRRQGAREVLVFAAHGLFTGDAPVRLGDPSIGRVVVTDSVPGFRVPATSPLAGKLTVVPAALLFIRALRGRHPVAP